jgi:hypothetical protein
MSAWYRLVLSLDINTRKSLTVDFHASCFLLCEVIIFLVKLLQGLNIGSVIIREY